MSKDITPDCHPLNIFDSRIATCVYDGVEYDYYRSQSFNIPAGYVAIVEMTTARQNVENLMFSLIRTPAINSARCGDLDNKMLGKVYRRWRCCRSLGVDNGKGESASSYTDYNKSILRLGFDNLNSEIVEFDYVTRPGEYYFTADKDSNVEITDCANPTLIEVTLLPVHDVPDLRLPCCDPFDACETLPPSGTRVVPALNIAAGLAATVSGDSFVIDKGTDCEAVYQNCEGTHILINRRTNWLRSSPPTSDFILATTTDSGGFVSVPISVVGMLPSCATHAQVFVSMSVNGTGQPDGTVDDRARVRGHIAGGTLGVTTSNMDDDNGSHEKLWFEITAGVITPEYRIEKGVSGAGGNAGVMFRVIAGGIL